MMHGGMRITPLASVQKKTLTQKGAFSPLATCQHAHAHHAQTQARGRGRGNHDLMGLIPFEGKHLPPSTGLVEAHLIAIQHLHRTYTLHIKLGVGDGSG